MKLSCFKLSEDAVTPTRSTSASAGWDLYTPKIISIPPNGKAVVKHDICLKFPEGYQGRIVARSGLALKHSIAVLGGQIDNDYR